MCMTISLHVRNSGIRNGDVKLLKLESSLQAPSHFYKLTLKARVALVQIAHLQVNHHRRNNTPSQ